MTAKIRSFVEEASKNVASMVVGFYLLLVHYSKNLALIALSFYLVPCSILGLAISYRRTCGKSTFGIKSGRNANNLGAGRPRQTVTVLVTGVSMQKGLTLARLFHRYNSYQETGRPNTRIRVIGADVSGLAMGRFSNSISRFYRLNVPKPNSAITGVRRYVNRLLEIIENEDVDLWVSCSGVASAVEDGIARDEILLQTDGHCKCVQFGVKDTKMLHEKASFIDAVKKAGLKVPETLIVKSVNEAKSMLVNLSDEKSGSRGQKKFIVKPLLVSDAFRGDMALLPLSTPAATNAHLAKLPISDKMPFIVQEYIDGPEYCTHSLVVKGNVRAFVACKSARILMHYEALPSQSVLVNEMLHFTEKMAAYGQKAAEARGDKFTGHLSFDFLVKNEDILRAEKRDRIDIWPIDCNPGPHTAVVLFDHDIAGRELVESYLKLVDGPETTNPHRHEHDAVRANQDNALYGASAWKYHWLPHDLVLFLMACISSLGRSGFDSLAWDSLQKQLDRLIGPDWKDATLDLEDPLPALVLWHIYWPAKLAESLWTGKKWSAVNVSTGKMFEMP